MGNFIEGLEGDIFVQEKSRDNWIHLDCAMLANLPLPLGDLTNVYCTDSRKGTVKVVGQLRGDPGQGTTTITTPLSSTLNWLFERRCAFPMLVTWACDGERGLPENFQIAAVAFSTNPTQPSISSPVVRERGENTRIDTPAEVSYSDLRIVYNIGVNVVSVSNTSAANGIAFLPETCATKCGNPRDACEEGYIALDGTLYDSEIKYTQTGVNWAQTSADPFQEGGDASSPVLLPLYDRHRAIVARISASTHLPAEVSYTEDKGASWSNVNVGNVVGAFFGRNGLVYASGRLYAAVSGGRIYDSRDIGDTWTLRASGITTEDLNAIIMEDVNTGYTVGNNNAFLYTVNGDDWYARTGPAPGTNLLSVAVNISGDVLVGAADGNLYRSEDGGQNWLQNDGITPGAWRSFGVGSIDQIKFDKDTGFFGLLVHNTPAPVGKVYRSINQGATWGTVDNQDGNWNSGLNDVSVCGPSHAFVVGEVHDGNTMIAQIEPL